MRLTGPAIFPKDMAPPKSIVVLLHGLGADGENMIGVAPFMAKHFPNTMFVAPNAPFQFDMYPVGYQWFSLTDRDPAKMLAGVKTAAPILDEFLDQLSAEFMVPDEKIALVGFSQGTMTSLYAAMRRKNKIAAIVGFSGSLIAPELIAGEAVNKPDVCLIHGEEDDVVPFTAMALAEKALKQNGFSVESHTRPFLPHSIDPEGIEIACSFLKPRLGY